MPLPQSDSPTPTRSRSASRSRDVAALQARADDLKRWCRDREYDGEQRDRELSITRKLNQCIV